MADLSGGLTYDGIPIWRHAGIIQWALQVVSGVLVVTLCVWFFANIGNAIADRGIPYGFAFLDREYQTPIGDHFIPYESSDTFRYALMVAYTNTIFVSVIGFLLATALGIFIGVARLSGNWIVSKLALAYIEFFRNVPLLVQLLFWLFVVLALPPVRGGYVIADLLYINNSGISFPGPVGGSPWTLAAWGVLAAVSVLAGISAHRWLARREAGTGRSSHPLLTGCVLAAALAAVSWLVVGAAAGEAPFVISPPGPQGRFGHIGGGFTIRAGLLVLLIGLVIYTAAYIAEIVRSGIQSVSQGQVEAGRALGLSQMGSLRCVVFPQALRAIVPRMIVQCLNLTKNSSLGVAVGYSDLTSVGLAMTQTAPAVSIFLIVMGAYLALSLTYSLIGSIYDRRISLVGL